MIINKQVVNRIAFLWNIIGSICSAGSSFYLLMIVTRACGASEAGIFSIAFASAQLMLTIGRYGMRAYQATDLHAKYSFSTYLTSRLISCFAMILVSIIYVMVGSYSLDKSLIIFWVCLIKMVDAIEDVFHGMFQQHYRIDIVGQLLTTRYIFTMIIFTIALLSAENLLTACIITAILSIIFCLITNMNAAKKITIIGMKWSFTQLRSLFYECSPLFIGTFLSLYIYNMPKNSIDIHLESEFQTYYSILFMPSFIISLFSEVIFKPLLTTTAYYWDIKQIDKFIALVLRIIVAIISIAFGVILISYYIGVEFLTFFYDINVKSYRLEFVVLLIGGTFSAIVYLLNNVLAAIRKQKSIIISYIFVAGISIFLSPALVKAFGIRGAAIAYLFSSSMLFFIFLGILIFNIIKVNVINQEDAKEKGNIDGKIE